LSRPSQYTTARVTKPQIFTADKEFWSEDYDSVTRHNRTLTVESLAAAEVLADGPIQTLKFHPGSIATIYHGVTLKRYKNMLRFCAWDRGLSSPRGDFCSASALYFSNDWTYCFMWSSLKEAGYRSMRLVKGVVIAVTLDLAKFPAVSYVTDAALESTIASHKNGVPVDGLDDIVIGGFRAAHKAELRGNGAGGDGAEAAGRAHLVNGEGCRDVAVEGLLQVAFKEAWGEEFLAEQEFKVCFSFASITGQDNSDSYSRSILLATRYRCALK
jgi:hypothetical protein